MSALHPTAQIVVELGHLGRLAHERALLDKEVSEHRRKLGRALRALRELRGMKLRDLAQRANVSPGFLSDLENGNRWSHEVIDRIRNILFTPAEGET